MPFHIHLRYVFSMIARWRASLITSFQPPLDLTELCITFPPSCSLPSETWPFASRVSVKRFHATVRDNILRVCGLETAQDTTEWLKHYALLCREISATKLY